MSRHVIPALAVTFCLALASCASDGGSAPETEPTQATGAASQFEQSYSDVEAYPVFASNELVLGRNRFVVGLLDDQDAPMADPAVKMEVSFFDISGSDPKKIASEKMRWTWIEQGVRGYYIGEVGFDQAGELGVLVDLQGGGIDEELRGKVEVKRESTTPNYGEVPPSSDTPTLADVNDVSEISTDTTPNPRFYEYSIAEALKRNEPSVVVFATPKFCQTAVCAPTLDNVQDVAQEFPKATFVHVEPYELGRLPEELVPVKSMTEWNLPSEPWVFVMNADGELVAKYEGVVAPAELRRDLKRAS